MKEARSTARVLPGTGASGSIRWSGFLTTFPSAGDRMGLLATGRLRLRYGRAALAGLLLLLALPLALRGQGRDGGDSQSSATVEYQGRFAFTRIRYGSGVDEWGFRGGGARWAHDYPRADRHLSQILAELTTISVHAEGTNVFHLDDPELFKHPVAYVSEPGFWTMTDSEARSVRSYLLRGGFLIFDDFEQEQWFNFEAQIQRVLPEYRLIELDISHPIFHCFFDLKNIDFPHPLVPVYPSYFGIFENNDPSQRMLAMVNYNADVAEYWEWSDQGFFPVDITNEAYKLGVNYVVFAMTH